jgi:central kinetochore subunit Mal2/MCM21
VKPYYVLLRQEGKGKQKEMKMCVHRHTIPAFIAVDRLAGVFLASSSRRRVEDEEGEEGEGGVLKSSRGARRQDLRGFVRELRRELVAWHLRCEAVGFLREKLGLDRDVDAGNEVGEEKQWGAGGASRNDLGIVRLEATAVEARYVRMEWEDGRLGRFKLSNAGLVERAVFMNDRGRDKVVEDAVTGGGGRIESLFERLKELEALEARS